MFRLFLRFVPVCVICAVGNDVRTEDAAGPNPFDGLILAVLNALVPKTNAAIEALLPDPLQLHLNSNNRTPDICVGKKVFGFCICHAGYDYAFHFGTITGLKELGIARFTSVDLDSNYEGEISAQFDTMDVKVFNGTAHAEGSACGLDVEGDGDVGVAVKIAANASVRVTGSFDFMHHCVTFNATGSNLTFTFDVHDPVLEFSVDKFPDLNLGPYLLEGFKRMFPDFNNVIEDEINKAIPALIVKEVNTLGCIDIFPGKPDSSKVVV